MSARDDAPKVSFPHTGSDFSHRITRGRCRLGFVAVIATLIVASVASAASPDGLGNGGYVLLGGSDITALGVQRSGRIVFSSGFGVWGLTPDGASDRRFAGRGGSSEDCNDGYCYYGFAMQRDDRIVVAGQHFVFRLKADGTPDTTFGTKGRVVVQGLRIQSVALTPDGALLVAGANELPDGSLGPVGGEVRLTRLLPSGVVDPAFGRGGSTSLDARIGWPVRVASQSDGGVILLGLGDVRGSTRDSTVARLTADGSLDTGFGESGFTTLARLESHALAIEPDGRIVVGGLLWPAVSGSGYPLGGVIRLDARGRPDASFGQDGVATLHKDGSTGYVDVISGLALEPDGSVVTAGAARNAACCRGSYGFLATVTADGQATRFELVGFGPDPEHDCWDEAASAVAVQPDAKIVVGGATCGLGSWISRYGEDLRLDEGSPLEMHRVRPPGSTRARAVRSTALVRLAATVALSAPASVAVSVRHAKPLESIPGELHAVASGRPVLLLSGSSVGRTTLRRSRNAVGSKSTLSGRVPLRLLLPSRTFPRGSWGVATVRALDNRGRNATLEIEFVTH